MKTAAVMFVGGLALLVLSWFGDTDGVVVVGFVGAAICFGLASLFALEDVMERKLGPPER